MLKRKTVHVSQLLPEPRKRPWWKHGGKGPIGLLKTVLKLLGLVLKLPERPWHCRQRNQEAD